MRPTQYVWKDRLSVAARSVVSGMLIHKMRSFVNSKIVGCINLGFSPQTLTIAKDLSDAAARSLGRVKESVEMLLTEEHLSAAENTYKNDIQRSFADGTWSKCLPGREILKNFVISEKIPVNYEVFRNMILNRMFELGIKPVGMKEVIDRIVAA
jgi:hypothetical protein